MQHSPLLYLCTLSIILFTLSSPIIAQNLVVNHSFEEAVKELDLENEITTISGWSSPNLAQPKIYTTQENGYVHDSYGSTWNFKAHSGKNVAAIYVYGNIEEEERREYVQGSLQQKLEVGKRYDFSFWVHYHCEGASSIGIAFLPNNIQLDKAGLIQLEPATYQKEVTLYEEAKTWTKVSGSFTAYQPLQYFVIGNFFSNEDTQLEHNWYDHHLAYIDDISVTESTEEAPIVPLSEKAKKAEATKWENNSKLAEKTPSKPASTSSSSKQSFLELPDILFDAGSSNLTASSLGVLEKLATELQTNPTLQINIVGHTSSEGGPDLNLTISQQRSWKVAKTLLERGVSAKQLEIRSVGSAFPIGSNDTEEGRKRNRRVSLSRYMMTGNSKG